jgi:hypothetical protein
LFSFFRREFFFFSFFFVLVAAAAAAFNPFVTLEWKALSHLFLHSLLSALLCLEGKNNNKL